MYVSFTIVRLCAMSFKLYELGKCMYVSFMLGISVSLGIGESEGHSQYVLLGLVAMLVSMVLGSGLEVERVIEMDEGVGVGGGAGSDQRSFETGVVVVVRERSIVDGVGDGGGAGSAQSSRGVMGLVMLVSALRLWVVFGLGVRGVVVLSVVGVAEAGEKVNDGAEGDSAGDVAGVEGSVAGVVGDVVGAARRCFFFRCFNFACRISCRRRIS